MSPDIGFHPRGLLFSNRVTRSLFQRMEFQGGCFGAADRNTQSGRNLYTNTGSWKETRNMSYCDLPFDPQSLCCTLQVYRISVSPSFYLCFSFFFSLPFLLFFPPFFCFLFLLVGEAPKHKRIKVAVCCVAWWQISTEESNKPRVRYGCTCYIIFRRALIITLENQVAIQFANFL